MPQDLKPGKINLPCHVCHTRGVLWLGGKDYVDCPECDGTGRITGWMEVKLPMPKHFIFGDPSPQKPVTVFHRDGSRPAGVVIAGRVS